MKSTNGRRDGSGPVKDLQGSVGGGRQDVAGIMALRYLHQTGARCLASFSGADYPYQVRGVTLDFGPVAYPPYATSSVYLGPAVVQPVELEGSYQLWVVPIALRRTLGGSTLRPTKVSLGKVRKGTR